jgi:hypothetical protein
MNGLTARAEREADCGLLPPQVAVSSELKPRTGWNLVTHTVGAGAITIMERQQAP